ncbi:diguanylate cyclase [Methylocaldum sp.]|uniref:diguanylate cyclase n=1 Tax=Methylocaldum sp. TaxID=1969727 RepID=UPI002D310172|nr:diguanylate cyclase [Methylocaldum sp.]HYE38077.1 diguanylate cyclase [Methylocaldum sp.]
MCRPIPDDSRPGRGAGADPHSIAAVAREAGEKDPQPDTPVILIADDMADMTEMLEETLGKEFRIKVANDGRSALALAAASPKPDLALLDVSMPGIDGLEVCRRLKADESTRDIAVIFLTSMCRSTDELRGFELGAVDYVAKPFQPPLVLSRIRNQVRLKRKVDFMETLACRDPLTSLANRRRLEEAMETEWARGARDRRPISMLMIDVDDFKAYNDHYGHGAGDRCLQELATAMAGVLVRPGDMLARYGGEEFAALLPDTGEPGALEVAEQLRSRVAALALPHAASRTTPIVTVSIGCATSVPGRLSWTARDLLELADRGLYAAKGKGRNCIAKA